MKNYKYRIQNLDCANCAARLEKKLNDDEHLENVNVNFSKLTITCDCDLDDVKAYLTRVSHEAGEDVTILELEDEHIHGDLKKQVIILTIGLVLALIGLLLPDSIIKDIVIILAYIVNLSDILYTAIRLLSRKSIDEHLLISISAIGAYFIGSIMEGLMVVILYKIGKVLETIAVNKTRKSIEELASIKPEYANLKKDDEIIKVEPDEVAIDDIIVVKKGEKIPLDGIVIKGSSFLDTSAITGESKLKAVDVNDEILSGCINTEDILEVKVTSTYENSTVASILNLVENASDKKTKTERFVAKFARIYTPIVLLLAILVLLILPLFDISWHDSLYKALTFLVISCPCAIAISVPLSYFAGIGRASKDGILIKGSDYLDALKNINEVIFDKTGTITTSEITNFKLVILDKTYKEKDIIDYYLIGESLSNHPLAKSIIKHFDKKIPSKDISNFKEISGKGISYKLSSDSILIGSSNFVESKTKDNSIYLKINDSIVAKLEKEDTIKENAKNTIANLKSLGIKSLMFTGDEESIATSIAKEVGITDVKYELLPEDKYNLLESELKTNSVAFVGDGINDTPSLARANVGISMGNIGSSSAIEASDVVIVNDDLEKVVTAVKIARKTRRIIVENLTFAISVKVLVMILSLLGLSTMWQAVFADTGLTLLTIINSTRILKK